mgnify:CR=1 FL=1
MTNRFSPEAELPKPSPDFDNLLAVLRCETPSRPTLFEFFHNDPLYRRLTKRLGVAADAPDWLVRLLSFGVLGYDYATVNVPNFIFHSDRDAHGQSTVSLNQGTMISDRKSFDAYEWPDPAAADYAHLDLAAEHLFDGMKLVIPGPGGVLENVIQLVGYESLCFMIVEDEQLVFDVFEQVGSRLVDFYARVSPHSEVGACISNDDWGFNLQTMLSPADMRRFVFPWHKRIVETIHAAGKPAILHSCGCYDEVIEDVIEDMKFDGRHSYEDNIKPIEQAYDELEGRIAVLGGIDVDFICRHSAEQVYERSKAMVERGAAGGYALGTGNSVPEYVPDEGFMAVVRAALDYR